jgi:uncharacterized protein with ParB-like and HNH nuclease domain
MAIIYTSESNKILSDFIKEIVDKDSTIVIPDLQRPYIWKPTQVILLVDSIFKRWPFGSLLCWDVKITKNASDFIPNRPFWEEFVSLIIPEEIKKSRETSINRGSNSFLMILDGQQRMQSLLLALGGESWGFTLTDKEWNKDIHGTDESIDSKHWSSGCLCLHVASFLDEYDKCNRIIAGIDVGKFLEWAITDINTGVSSKDKKQVLPITSLDDGEYLRFSKIWNTAKPSGKLPSDYEDILTKAFSEIPQEKLNKFIKPLSEFMTIVAEVKVSTVITRLIIRDFESSGLDDRGNYNDAIVNIFARLNTAGRALTRQEVTLAWLKTGWREANLESETKIDCDAALKKLLAELNDNGENTGMQMEIDNLVDILSLFWIIVERSGDDKSELVLDDEDLVNGNKVKNIGKSTFKFWTIIKEVILECKDTFEDRNLNECFSRSFYAFYIICGWKFIAAISSRQNEGRIRETDCKFTIQINTAFDMFIDKWYFSTQLSDTWSDRNKYPNYVGKLCKLHKIIVSCHDPDQSINFLSGELDAILSDLRQSAVTRINGLRAYNRHEVIAYKNILWLWNRLTLDRWSEVKRPMRRKSAAPKLEVDHAIPVDIWNEKVENEYPLSTSKDPTGQEVSFVINGTSYTRSTLLYEINILGNCSLLLRSHNRSKGKEPFGIFLNDVYNSEPEQIERVKDALLLNDTFLSPLTVTIEKILIETKIRTDKIKSELIDYFNQKEQKRQDVV